MPDDSKEKSKRDCPVLSDAIIDYVVERMSYCVRKYVLKKEVSIILYGEEKDADGKDTGVPKKLIAINTFERLRKKAREILQSRAVSGSEEARQESIGFYENMLEDPKVSSMVKVKVRENLDKILGVASVLPTQPLSGTLDHNHIVKLKDLGLTIEQQKKILEDRRADDT